MTVLFTQYWDVIPGKFDEYSAFVMNEYNPTLERLGINLVGGFYVIVGQGPRIMAVATVDEQNYLRKILATEDYRLISAKLQCLVWQYSSKLYVSSGRVIEGPYRIQTGAWKFNQYLQCAAGDGGRALSLRQGRVHPRNERIESAYYRRMAPCCRRRPHNSR